MSFPWRNRSDTYLYDLCERELGSPMLDFRLLVSAEQTPSRLPSRSISLQDLFILSQGQYQISAALQGSSLIEAHYFIGSDPMMLLKVFTQPLQKVRTFAQRLEKRRRFGFNSNLFRNAYKYLGETGKVGAFVRRAEEQYACKNVSM